IDGYARTLQVQKEGNARGQNGGRAAREAVRAQLVAPRQQVIVPGSAADEDATLAPEQHSRIISGVFDRVPARLQEQALLRIHTLGFCRRDVEKQRVEQVKFFQGAKPLTVGLAWRSVAGLIVCMDIPAVGRYPSDAILPLRNVLPELLDVSGLWELSGHADHCNGL